MLGRGLAVLEAISPRLLAELKELGEVKAWAVFAGARRVAYLPSGSVIGAALGLRVTNECQMGENGERFQMLWNKPQPTNNQAQWRLWPPMPSWPPMDDNIH